MKRVQAAKNGYIISSAVFCAAGIFLLLWPGISAALLCMLMGVLLLLCGIVKIWGYFSEDPYQLAFQFDLAFGLLSGLMGLVMLMHRDSVISFLHFAVGIIALVDGLFKFQTALDARRFGLEKWRVILAAAVLTNAAGFLLVLNPFQKTEAYPLLMLMGITLLLEGALNLCVALSTVKIQRQNENRLGQMK